MRPNPCCLLLSIAFLSLSINSVRSLHDNSFVDNLVNGLLNEESSNVRPDRSDDTIDDNEEWTKPEPEEAWTGPWFPAKPSERPSSALPPERPSSARPQPELHLNRVWQMINSTCDDGRTNLTVDWSGNPMNHTCYSPRGWFSPDLNLPIILQKDNIPPAYVARHECMDKSIEYPFDLPTFGPHRPAWPRYGEYKFLPRQRWIHSLEHGAVVMLYHPCAHPHLVGLLREAVTSCLYRHIITPYTLLTKDRPLALVTWGRALLMSYPSEEAVVPFIQQYALHGPEDIPADGQLDHLLEQPASVVSDSKDSVLCPQTLF